MIPQACWDLHLRTDTFGGGGADPPGVCLVRVRCGVRRYKAAAIEVELRADHLKVELHGT